MCPGCGSRRVRGLSTSALVGIVLTATLMLGERSARAQTPVTIGGPFTLTAADGSAVTDATFRGKWLLVFFGYTFCPDLCPTTLMDIAGALQKLGPDAGRVQALFITVDPERDTPEVMGQYTAAFDPRIAGLTGTREQVDATAAAYGAHSERRKISADDTGYVVDHSTYLYIMDPQGRFVRGLSFDTPSERIAGTLRDLMARP